MSGVGMLTSIRGGAAAAGAVSAPRAVSSRLSGPAPTASIPTIPENMSRGVTVAISQAGLDAARRRAAAPMVGRVQALGTTGEVPEVRPRLLNLSTSESLPKHGPLSGNALMSEGTEVNRKPSLHTSIATGQVPLGQWNDTNSYSALKHMRPGADIERDGARSRSANTLSARLSHGAVPLGQWNGGEYEQMVNALPGREIRLEGERARRSTTLTARIGKGEEPLEVMPGRHLVRPDGEGNAS